MKTQAILIPSRITFLSSLVLTVFAHLHSAAQTYPYKVDFESANTSPSSKAYASLDTITVDNIKWLMPGVFLGGATVSDFHNGARSARMRLTNNDKGDPAYMEMHSDLPHGVGTISLETAMWKDETGGKLLIYYSTDKGSSWTPIDDTIRVPANNTPTRFSRTINQSGPIRIKIAKVDLTNVRINVDDIEIDKYDIFVTEMTPLGDNVPLSIDQLTISYDIPIEKGDHGNITLYEIGGSEQAFAVQSSSVTLSDSTAVISGINLKSSTRYYVTLDAGVFKEMGGSLLTEEIKDSTYWTFLTEDEPLSILTSLNETFDVCDDENNKLGVFKQYNIHGDRIWGCTDVAHTDSHAVRISGRLAAELSEENKDWLISSIPIDLSSMQSPQLSLWQKSRFEGQVTRTIQISTDYTGDGNPEEATWTVLNIDALHETPFPENIWMQIKDIDLSEYKAVPFYLAFTYECGTSGAWELTYDDIVIEDATAIQTPENKNIGIKVLSQPLPSEITLSLSAARGGRFTACIYDLTGRLVHTEHFYMPPTSNGIHRLSNLNLKGGLYIIKVNSGTQYGVTKAAVK